jgi:hypothetical protein
MTMPTEQQLKARLQELGFYDPSDSDPKKIGEAIRKFQAAMNLGDGPSEGPNFPIRHGACCHVTQKALWPDGM